MFYIKRTVRLKLNLSENERHAIEDHVLAYNKLRNTILTDDHLSELNSRTLIHNKYYFKLRESDSKMPSYFIISLLETIVGEIRSKLSKIRFLEKKQQRCEEQGKEFYNCFNKLLTNVKKFNVSFKPLSGIYISNPSFKINIVSKQISIVLRSSEFRKRSVFHFSVNPYDFQYLTRNGVRYRSGYLYIRENEWYFNLVVMFPIQKIYDTSSINWLGLDIGVRNMVVTSTGKFFNDDNYWPTIDHFLKIQTSLQKCGSKSAKRKLKKRNGKISRYTHDVIYKIANKVIRYCLESGHTGMVLEQLKYANRLRVSKGKRMHTKMWPYRKIQKAIVNKAEINGITIKYVLPNQTSIKCSSCGFIDSHNRIDQSTFKCGNCGFELNADINAAINIRDRHSL